jgi:hypothetical protein
VAFGVLPEPLRLRHVTAERIGDDVMVSGYLRDP